MPTSAEYWADREAQKQAKVDEITDKDVELVRTSIEGAVEGLTQSIRELYRKYAFDNGMDYYTALQYLTDDERAEFQRDLQYYVDKYKDSEYVKQNRQELQSLSVRARVQRIDTVIAEIKKYAGSLEEHLNKETRGSMDNLYMEGYLRSQYEALEGKAPSLSFTNAFPYEKVQKILDIPWSGKNYSKKVWDTTGDFAETLQTVLTRGLIQGKHPDVIAREFRVAGFGKEERNKDGSVKRRGLVKRAEDLIRTEAAYVIEQAQLDSYVELNVEEYRYKVEIDGRQCATCENLNDSYFLVDEVKAGINYPPMHVNCRCTTKPKSEYDDEDENKYDLPYDEWCAKYVQPEVGALHRKQLGSDDTNNTVSEQVQEFLSKTQEGLKSSQGGTSGASKVLSIVDIEFKDDAFNDFLIKSFAKEYVDSKIENAMVLSPSDKAYLISGTSGNVNVFLAGEDLIGSKVIHNHPKYHGLVGDNFSLEDFELFFEQQLNSLYVKNGRGLFRFSGTKSISGLEAKKLYLEATYKYQDTLTYEVLDDIQYQTMLLLSKENDWITFEEIKE